MVKLNVVSVTSRTISFEINTREPYYTGNKYLLYLNSTDLGKVDKNVFTIKNLDPDKEYSVSIKNIETGDADEIVLRTKPETAYINVRDFGANGDGKRIDTFSIQAAIISCPDGGRVFFPRRYLLDLSTFFKKQYNVGIRKRRSFIRSKREGDVPYPSWRNRLQKD